MPEAVFYQNGTIVRKVSFTAPARLSELSDQIPQPCGGKGYCGKCRVQVRGHLSRLTKSEYDNLSAKEREQGFRLACQAMATGNISITLPAAAETKKADMADVPSVAPLGKEYGFVLDLGTTTISAALYHLPSGKKCGQKSAANPQSFDGADVLTRIDHAMHGDARRLSTTVQHALFDICASLLMGQRLAPNDADAAVLVGNTAMLYLLLEKDPVSISAAPFRSDTLFGDFFPADFLPVRKGTKLYVPPCISAFLGADATSAVLGSRLDQTDSAILADLGTNAEMILRQGDGFLGCSCAAGPAFEGVGLTYGMPAVDGAVHTVRLSGGYYSFQTVNEAVPKGFCGSGLVDMIACMVRSGALQKDGKLTGADRFYLDDTPLYLSQQDIRAFQLAKSAVRTGLEVLQSRAAQNVQALYLAGTFGAHLHPASACRIGLLPASLQKNTIACGNAAGTGGAMLLLDQTTIRKAEAVASHTQTIQLADLPQFQNMLCQFTMLE